MNRYARVNSLMADDGYGMDYRSEEEDMMMAPPKPAPLANIESKQVTPDTSGSDKQKELGNALTTAGALSKMSTSNPYLIAAGLGLQTLGAAKERELKRETQNVNNEIARRDRVVRMLSQLGQGFGRLG